MTEEQISRFWEKVQVGNEDECWPWLGATERDGRGVHCLGGGKRINPQRFVLQLKTGTLPHRHRHFALCSHNWCCNPAHLTMDRFWTKVDMGNPDGCWEWLAFISPNGYGMYSTDTGHELAHRVSWEKSNGRPVPDGLFVLHHCDNRKCVRPDHIYVGTHLDNARDRVVRGRSNTAFGERQHKAKLTDEDVAVIRDITGMRHIDIAAAYGVSKSTITSIRGRKTWRHVA